MKGGNVSNLLIKQPFRKKQLCVKEKSIFPMAYYMPLSKKLLF